MPSKRITKTNIDQGTLELVQIVAAAKGVSATRMLEVMVLFYIDNATTNNPWVQHPATP